MGILQHNRIADGNILHYLIGNRNYNSEHSKAKKQWQKV
jgi:hypothetical protein